MTAVTLHTGDGIELHADYAPATTTTPAPVAAVLLYPHPLMGGDLHAQVPSALARTLPEAGVAVLRFDFRGAGGSGGSHGGGDPEALDVLAALEWLHGETARPLWLIGWSFGADVSLQVAEPAVAGWIAVTPPLASVDPEAMAAAGDPRPKRLLVAEHDQFCDPALATERTAGWVNSAVELIPGADHFLAGRLSWVTDRVLEALA
jgi:alpha/beta superfamily hydrolase